MHLQSLNYTKEKIVTLLFTTVTTIGFISLVFKCLFEKAGENIRETFLAHTQK